MLMLQLGLPLGDLATQSSSATVHAIDDPGGDIYGIFVVTNLLVLHALTNAHDMLSHQYPLYRLPMCQYSPDNGHMTDWHPVHIGVRVLSSFSMPCWENMALRRAALAESSWRRPRSCRRAASPRKTRGSGPTRRSRRSSGLSTYAHLHPALACGTHGLVTHPVGQVGCESQAPCEYFDYLCS